MAIVGSMGRGALKGDMQSSPRPEATTPSGQNARTEERGRHFDVCGRRLSIAPHPDADRLELAQIEGTDYRAIVLKGEYESGDLAIYIPEGAVVPEAIIAELGLEGRLAGKDKNRVKAVRLRGALSQGLVYRPQAFEIEEGHDYQEELGIIKWLPPVPTSLSGQVEPSDRIRGYTDIANIKKYPNVLEIGEAVLATEKTHGSATCFSYTPGYGLEVSSKGMAQKGLAILPAEGNAYWKMATRFGIEEKLARFSESHGDVAVHLYGETYGVQDLMYGLQKGQLDFRAFDLRVEDRYLDAELFEVEIESLGLERMPTLYRGPYSPEAIDAVTSGPETISGNEAHIREGVVVRPVKERIDSELGRVILKSISPDYLVRRGKGGDEPTEFE